MIQHTSEQQKQDENQQKYEKTQMQREIVIQRLKEQGCRITKQRMVLLDIILNENCSSCKEIYYKASKIDSSIGSATVYRMINMLEEIGAINRRNMYKVSCTECEEAMDELPGGTSRSACTIEFDDNSSIVLSQKAWNQIIQAGLSVCGYKKEPAIRSITPA